MDISFFITVAVSLAVCGLGGLVALSPATAWSRRTFTLLCFALAAWVMSNYLSDYDLENSLFWARGTFFSVTLAVMAFAGFVSSFVPGARPQVTERVFFWTGSLAMASIVWLDQFLPSVFFVLGEQTANVVAGPLYPLFIVYFVVTIGIALWKLVVGRRRAKGLQRQRLTFVLLAVAAMTLIGSMTNLLLPLFSGVNPLSRLGTYSTVIFTGIIAYAIIRHRLFSIRFVIARSLVYLLTLVTLTAVFALVVFGLLEGVVSGQLDEAQSRVLYISIAVLTAFIYQPVRAFFDKLTRQIFFHDLYDSRLVLKELSAVAVKSVLPQDLLRKSIKKLNAVISPSFIEAYVRSEQTLRSIANVGKATQIPIHALDRLPRRTIIVTDEVMPESRWLSSIEQLQRSDVAVVVRMMTAGEQVGYLLLGYKRSGGSYSNQDLALLGTVADELAVAVQNALRFEEIKRFNETLQEEVAEATLQLRQNNQKLRELDLAKDEFISMASHQLRTPLTSVKGYLSMALEGDAGELDESQRHLLQEAYGSAQRMVYLITDFLNVSRLQTGKFVLERTPTNLSQLIRQEITQLGPAAASRNLDIIANIPTNFPKISIDEEKIRQVVMNFIDNAIFYSKAGGDITITLTHHKEEVVFTVKDQGIGVPADEKHRLFDKFFRATNARHVRPDGTGIGLFMAKKVVDAHGGEVLFDTKEGKGSTFGFRLPLGAE